MTIQELVMTGLLAASFRQILTVPWEMLQVLTGTWFEWLFPHVQIHDLGSTVVFNYILKQGRVLYKGDSWWTFAHRYVRPERRSKYIFLEHRGAGCHIVWFRGTLVFMGHLPWNSGASGVLRMFRWGLDRPALLKEIQDSHQVGAATGRFMVYHSSDSSFPWGSTARRSTGTAAAGMVEAWENTKPAPTDNNAAPPINGDSATVPLGYAPDEIGPLKPDRPMVHYAKSPESQRVVDDFEFWINNRSWYTTKEIPHRRGYGLYGRPGTGKTTLIRALAQDHDLPLMMLSLSQLSNTTLRWMMQGFQSMAPGIVVIEDVDGVFHGRERVSQEEGALTFDGLLEALDGVEQLDGLAVFVTSNHPELLDEALTRDGRLDVRVTLPPPDRAGKRLIAEGIMDSVEEAEEMVAESPDGETAAEFKGRCIEVAQRALWARRAA